MEDVASRKKTLRKEMANIIQSIPEDQVQMESQLVYDKVIKSDFFEQAQSIAIYVSTKREINTDKLITYAELLDEYRKLETTLYGIRQHPKESLSKKSGLLDLMIMTGIAFSVDGQRLGHGKGHYDVFCTKSSFISLPTRFLTVKSNGSCYQSISFQNQGCRPKKTKKEKDPNAPKRGMSGYMLWLKENRARLTKPGMGVTDVSKAAGVEWNQLKDKSKWDKAAQEDKKRYEKEIAAYNKKKCSFEDNDGLLLLLERVLNGLGAPACCLPAINGQSIFRKDRLEKARTRAETAKLVSDCGFICIVSGDVLQKRPKIYMTGFAGLPFFRVKYLDELSTEPYDKADLVIDRRSQTNEHLVECFVNFLCLKKIMPDKPLNRLYGAPVCQLANLIASDRGIDLSVTSECAIQIITLGWDGKIFGTGLPYNKRWLEHYCKRFPWLHSDNDLIYAVVSLTDQQMSHLVENGVDGCLGSVRVIVDGKLVAEIFEPNIYFRNSTAVYDGLDGEKRLSDERAYSSSWIVGGQIKELEDVWQLLSFGAKPLPFVVPGGEQPGNSLCQLFICSEDEIKVEMVESPTTESASPQSIDSAFKLTLRQAKSSAFVKVALIGAGGGVGQALALLLKNNCLINELAVYSRSTAKGVFEDLSHIHTPTKAICCDGISELHKALENAHIIVIVAGIIKGHDGAFLAREEAFNANAEIVMEICEVASDLTPSAMYLLVTNPINSLVPLISEILKSKGVFDGKRLFGLSSLDVSRANTLLQEAKNLSSASIPVIGGHSTSTIVPLFSQAKLGGLVLSQEEIVHHTTRIRTAGMEVFKAKKCKVGSATLSTAHVAAKFVDDLVKAINGKRSKQYAFVHTELVPDVNFMAGKILLGPNGIQKFYSFGVLSDYENLLLKSALEELKKSAEEAKQFFRSKKANC
uniref:Malate dehydrogenase, mitochondrial n=1 Tax=Ditylenchus dipsaci TaxID=166011 RepID=A0A915EB65_9BILA